VNRLSGEIGGKGIFIKEIEEAILGGRVDLAVHSMKDVPTEFSAACHIAIVFEREDPRDCLISRDKEVLSKLPHGARVGTSSVRRASQLRHFRPDLEVLTLRGNVDTRLRKLDAGDFDAIVVASAGITRLGLALRIAELLPPETMLPAVGQGALGVEFLESSEDLFRPFLSKLENRETIQAIACERALQKGLEGGCTVPLGAWARMDERGAMRIDARVLSLDGRECVSRSRSAPCANQNDAEDLGRRLAREMLAAGADRLLRLVGRNASGN
jgi:hydroxymethylbilane synthase